MASINTAPSLDNLMHYPMNIKAAQIAEKRKKFDSLPSFIQAGLFLYEKLNNVRRQDFFPKLFSFEVLKNEGNLLFSEGRFEEAARKYEEALCIFRYIKSESARWREEGIDDKYLNEVEVKGTSQDEQAKINSLKLLCYLNLAACNLKLNNPKTSIDACNEALKIDPQNVKALYRRAKARLMIARNGDENYRDALKDFEQAIKLDPSNKFIKGEYENALKRLKVEETKLSSPSPSMEEMLTKSMSAVPTTPYQQESKLIEEVPEILTLNEAIEKGENAVKVLESVGKFDMAHEQKENLSKIKHVKECLYQLIHMDIEKPAQKMKDQAKLLGITFSDEEIRKDLLKMKRNNLEEARGLIRKSLGLPPIPPTSKPIKEPSAPEQASTYIPKAVEEEKLTFENRATVKAGQTPSTLSASDQNDVEKLDTQIPPKLAAVYMAQKKNQRETYIFYGVMIVFIMATIIGYAFVLLHAKSASQSQ